MLSRRHALTALAGGLATAILAEPCLSLARLPGERRLVVVVLRGGLDGLAAVPPYADPDYRTIRGSLALENPGGADGLIDLDGFFGLHPALGPIEPMYRDGQLLPLHAVASPYRGRSHFDAQDVLENGVTRPGRRDGWLNRALLAIDPERTRSLGLAIGGSVPLILRGEAPVASWSPSPLPLPDPTLLQQIAALWQEDPLLGPAIAEGLKLREGDMPTMTDGAGRRMRSLNRGKAFAELADKAGQLLARTDGPRLAVLECGGWDTHKAQHTGGARLTRQLAFLAKGLLALKASLGTAWNSSAIVIVTEFGRTARPNGTNGTDHGTAGVAFLAGGPIAGGRVHADWPGLKREQLYEDRYLRPTRDLRSWFKGVLRDHLGLDGRSLDTAVFPDSHDVPAMDGLFRA